MRSDAKFSYEMSVNGQTLHKDYLDAHIQQGNEGQIVISSGTSETQFNDSYSLFCYFPRDLCKILMITFFFFFTYTKNILQIRIFEFEPLELQINYLSTQILIYY